MIERKREETCVEVMTESFPEMVKDTNPRIQDTQQIPNKIKFFKEIHTQVGHSKTAEHRDQEKMLSSQRERKCIYSLTCLFQNGRKTEN